jgi:hypothetical protein
MTSTNRGSPRARCNFLVKHSTKLIDISTHTSLFQSYHTTFTIFLHNNHTLHTNLPQISHTLSLLIHTLPNIFPITHHTHLHHPISMHHHLPTLHTQYRFNLFQTTNNTTNSQTTTYSMNTKTDNIPTRTETTTIEAIVTLNLTEMPNSINP